MWLSKQFTLSKGMCMEKDILIIAYSKQYMKINPELLRELMLCGFAQFYLSTT